MRRNAPNLLSVQTICFFFFVCLFVYLFVCLFVFGPPRACVCLRARVDRSFLGSFFVDLSHSQGLRCVSPCPKIPRETTYRVDPYVSPISVSNHICAYPHISPLHIQTRYVGPFPYRVNTSSLSAKNTK